MPGCAHGGLCGDVVLHAMLVGYLEVGHRDARELRKKSVVPIG